MALTDTIRTVTAQRDELVAMLTPPPTAPAPVLGLTVDELEELLVAIGDLEDSRPTPPPGPPRARPPRPRAELARHLPRLAARPASSSTRRRPSPPAAPAPELLVVRLAIELEAAPTLATTLAMLGYRDQSPAPSARPSSAMAAAAELDRPRRPPRLLPHKPEPPATRLPVAQPPRGPLRRRRRRRQKRRAPHGRPAVRRRPRLRRHPVPPHVHRPRPPRRPHPPIARMARRHRRQMERGATAGRSPAAPPSHSATCKRPTTATATAPPSFSSSASTSSPSSPRTTTRSCSPPPQARYASCGEQAPATRSPRRSKTPARPVPLRMRGATNPGGRGHAWVKRRFITKRPRPDDPDDTPAKCRRRVFIPARLADNPHIDHASYVEALGNLTREDRARLLGGDWDVDLGDRYYDQPGIDAALAIGQELDYLLEHGGTELDEETGEPSTSRRPRRRPPRRGVDWGDHAFYLVGWPLEAGGLYVVAGGPCAPSSPAPPPTASSPSSRGPRLARRAARPRPARAPRRRPLRRRRPAIPAHVQRHRAPPPARPQGARHPVRQLQARDRRLPAPPPRARRRGPPHPRPRRQRPRRPPVHRAATQPAPRPRRRGAPAQARPRHRRGGARRRPGRAHRARRAARRPQPRPRRA
jgi:hypothetical protein